MELQAAKKLVEQVFNNSYDRSRYLDLVSNLLKFYDQDNKSINISNSSHQFNNFTFLGSYQDSNKTLGIYEVEVSNYKTLLNARVAQRDLIASELKKEGYEIGLASFYVKEENQWRFSLITFESSIDLSSEKIKFIENLSPSKRKSFLAGKNEGTHTAKKQLFNLLKLKENPTVEQIEAGFELEPINNDFYQQYKELYLKLTEYLEKFIQDDPVISEDFQKKDVKPSDFAKKTLGQFIFLYFIQRKGWIKSKNNLQEDFYLFKLFDNRFKYGNNFFNDLIEPIFYESLSKLKPNLNSYKIINEFDFPYLNGGLFEPIRGYDWERTNIIIDDSFFKNDNKTRDGDIGDGLLNVFDRFNFTVFENDQLEQDIAVDPEMLGKVFENLLDIKDRKSKGAFYTPREIVKYMCQESLINYLISETQGDISPDLIELFITNNSFFHEDVLDNDDLYQIKENAIKLDLLLSKVKVCDPAVGSGAFPMGMLSEIVGARKYLQKFLSNKKNIYELKLHSIAESIYGVDIDPSAIEIARLRLWLSLIIEEDNPTPLPNLEHKIMQGNSLLSSYQGVELFNDQFLVKEDHRQEKLKIIDKEINLLEQDLRNHQITNDISKTQDLKKKLIRLSANKLKIQNENSAIPQTDMLFENRDELYFIKQQVDLLQNKISQFLIPAQNNKETLKKEIDDLKWALIDTTVNHNKADLSLMKLKDKRILPFFLWKLEFVNVFRENDGFDIVIGNPPYIQFQKTIDEEKNIKLGDLYIDKGYETFCKTGDIYTIFYELALNLSKSNGHICFITSNKWMRAAYGSLLRSFLSRFNPKKLIDFSSKKVFKTALVDVNIITIEKYQNENNVYALNYKDNINDAYAIFQSIKNNSVKLTNLNDKQWNILSESEFKIQEKIENIGTPLSDWEIGIFRGVLTGLNKAFLITKNQRDEFINLDTKNSRILKPILRGKDIKEFSHSFQDIYLIDTHNGYIDDSGKKISHVDINEFPEIRKYLDSFIDDLKKRGDKGLTPYNLRNNASYLDFFKEKIMYSEIVQKPQFWLDLNGNFFPEASCFIMTGKDLRSLVGIFHSKLFNYIFRKFYSGGGLGDSGYRFKKVFLEQVPIPLKKDNNMSSFKQIEDYVLEILNNDSKDKELIHSIQKKIDILVYQIYDLDSKETDIIEMNS